MDDPVAAGRGAVLPLLEPGPVGLPSVDETGAVVAPEPEPDAPPGTDEPELTGDVVETDGLAPEPLAGPADEPGLPGEPVADDCEEPLPGPPV